MSTDRILASPPDLKRMADQRPFHRHEKQKPAIQRGRLLFGRKIVGRRDVDLNIPLHGSSDGATSYLKTQSKADSRDEFGLSNCCETIEFQRWRHKSKILMYLIVVQASYVACRRSNVLRCIALVVFSVLLSVSASADDSVIGTWSSTVDQPGFGSYPAVMTFKSAREGTSAYPSLNCGGSLVPEKGVDTNTFKETITFGRSGCLDGFMQIEVDGDTMEWRWSNTLQGDDITASGTLVRSDQLP